MNEFIKFWEEYKVKYGSLYLSGNTENPNRSVITDKGTSHDYIQNYYADIFGNIRDENIRLVEIGIGDGYSLVLWRDWFRNAEIFGIEYYPYRYGHPVPFETEGVTSIFKNAYNQETIDMFEDNSIDYLIDDGDHVLSSQLFCLEHWLPKIKIGGKIIIEDVQDIEYIKKFKDLIYNKKLNVKFKIFDTRKSRTVPPTYDENENILWNDDLIFEITKISKVSRW